MPLTITVPEGELYDYNKNEFINIDREYKITMEHSLIAISKWESYWHKRYMEPDAERTEEEIKHYLKCMTISPKDVPIEVYSAIPYAEIERINKYLADPMTATTFGGTKKDNKPPKEIYSSELIYYYMFKLGIPKECEKWHINRLITLLEVFGIKDGDQKKMSKGDRLARFNEINRRNRAKYNTKG